MCDELTGKRKRSFAEAWLTDERYKSWIRKVPSDNNLFYCSVCNKNFSCNSTHISKHPDSVYHKSNITKKSLPCSNSDDNLPIKKCRKLFKQE